MKIKFYKTYFLLLCLISALKGFGQCPVPVPTNERDALVALYNTTDGANWTNNTNWNTTADVCDWYGVTVTDGNVISINLTNNNLIGNIPLSMGSLSLLTTLNLDLNQLSGDIPDFSGVTHLSIDNNAFVFNNFENEHNAYTTNLTTYTYNPQAKVDQEETPTVLEGNSYTFTTNLSSPNNSYQWYKDGVAITDATSKDYTINSVALTDSGVYHVIATNSIVTGLTLERNTVTLSVTTDTCGVSEAEKQALLDLYTSTNGANWINTLANNQPWDTNIPVCDWYGVTVVDGKVIAVNLPTNNLTGNIPDTIGGLLHLNTLDLGDNNITGAIPLSLGTLLELEILLLPDNQLTGELPPALGSLSNLVTLDLSNNNLQSQIPISFCNLAKVTELNLSNNQLIGSIPSQLSLMQSLIRLDLRNNQLEGAIPYQIAGLYNLEFLGLSNNNFSGTIPITVSVSSNLEEFVFENNNFIFSDFESRHPSYTANLNVGYIYIPQAKTDIEETKTVTVNNPITLTTQLSSENNTYQWFKDGVAIDGATEREYTIDNALETDAGVYHFTATNSIIIGLTLERNPITLNVMQTCDVVSTERQALIDLYTTLGGTNWSNTLAGNQPWLVNDANASVCDWYGVVVENNSVVELNLSANALTGTLPDIFASLPALQAININNNNLQGSVPASIAAITGLGTLAIENNSFVFTDIETEFLTYNAKLGTGFTYNLQAKVDTEIIETVNETGAITLTTTALTSANNSYQWYKSGLPIAGATSKELTLTNVTSADAGAYYFEATNTVVNGLTLIRHFIKLEVLPADDTCGVSSIERDALMAFYNATDGANWANTLANNQPWDVNVPVCDWYGVTVTDGTVTSLNLSNNQLTGIIPTSLGNLVNLEFLRLGINSLTGTIPDELGNLGLLEQLQLQSNQLTGIIPTSLGNLVNLETLLISNNNLTGTIPDELGNLGLLEQLQLQSNQLTGIIPTSLGNLVSLETLLISNNNLTGTIPNELGNLLLLEQLQLSYNDFTNSIPTSLGNLVNLKVLWLHNNSLTGTIPDELGNLPLLEQLLLSNNDLTGTIPPSLSTISSLQYFWSQNNAFVFNNFENEHNTYTTNLTTYNYTPQAKVDQEETKNVLTGESITLTSTALTSVNNSYQWYKDGVAITGETNKDLVISNITEADAGVYYFEATNSIVTGLTLTRNDITLNVGIPGACEVSEADRQILIDFYNATNGDSWANTINVNQPWLVNDSTSSVCDWYGVTVDTASKVVGIQLPNNNVRGDIPTFIENLIDLKTLDLSENDVIGEIPATLSNLVNLETLNLSGNVLVGEIPETIGNLTALQTLNLGDNRFSEAIPSTIGNLQGLVSLDLSVNKLTDGIPSSLYTLLNLESVKLQDNTLNGTINSAIDNLVLLQEFWLSNNNFSGSIPTTITNIPVLRSVRLDNNSFNGDIPLLIPNFSVPNTEVKIENNRFVFSDFEAEYPDYSTQLDVFTYDPQAKVDITETISVLEGDPVTLGTVALTSPNNSYVWYKDGAVIPGATSSSYTIPSFDPLVDVGAYYFIASNSTIANLELTRNTIYLVERLPVEDLSAVGVCSINPFTYKQWEITNPNVLAIEVNWQILGTSQSGTFTAIQGTNLLTTSTETGGNTIEIKWLNERDIEQSTQAISNDTYCYPPADCIDALIGSVDGSFETATTALNNGRNGNLDGTSWVIGTGTPDAFVLPYSNEEDPYLTSIDETSPNGGICVGALRDNDVAESFTTTVSGLTNGVTYIVEFYQSNATYLLDQEFLDEALGFWEVTLGSTTKSSESMYPNSGLTTWERQKLEFTATASSEQLEFKVGSSSSNPTNVYEVYVLIDGIRVYSKPAIPYSIECVDINTQVFCNIEEDNEPTIADLVAPEGGNVTWYSKQIGGELYSNDLELTEIETLGRTSASFVWADNGSGDLRVPVEILFDLGAPEGPDAQFFDIASNSTIADLQAEGIDVTWYASYTSTNPLPSTTPLINGVNYYAANGENLCRLAVNVSIGVPTPNGDGFQEFCSTTNPTIDNLVMEVTSASYELFWYSEEIGGNLYNSTDALENGVTYYAVQRDGNNNEGERVPVDVSIIDVASEAIIYERDITLPEGYTLASLTDFFGLDSTVLWYDAAQGGTSYSSSYEVLTGETYYARFSEGLCPSLEVLAVTVTIADVEEPELITCIKFVPQPGAEYVISGWVREEELVAEPAGTKDFNDDTEAKEAFTRILQKIADEILNKKEIPETFVVESFFEEDLNSDVLLPYIKNFTGNKVTIYDFKFEQQNFQGVFKTIGFSFFLDPDTNFKFVYNTPNIEYRIFGRSYTSSYKYPLLNYDFLTLTFKDVKVENGIFQIVSDFEISAKGNEEAFTEVSSNNLLRFSGNDLLSFVLYESGIEETIQLFDYSENPDYEVMEYVNGVIELSYKDVDENDIILGTAEFIPKGAIIDGWQRISTSFTIPNDAAYMKLTLKNKGDGLNAYFDDVRMHPFNSNIKSFVYDPVTQRLQAELDENNYATFYEYDTEGGLVRVKKETERGVYTIQETRSGNSKLNQ
ncbi:immunoglobulin domain-containing protein [Flavivirga aquimarina]|uniref:Immunoglobulin domain-containing protein n=1 Tax=Flavivirga aquimarina TaxID=2027862 RepID=A0ABT8W9I3_9FLAO|nr:immunoglobulin domain-containing protein [Flavivirga aquimarina]MDO5969779.1 immunoglobulin domain-containing protein [Flavivirga aquimarina]